MEGQGDLSYGVSLCESSSSDQECLGDDKKIPLTDAPSSVDKSKSKFDTRSRKALLQRIGDLSEIAHTEIFRKLKRAGVDHTKNKNGVFINLSVVNDALLEEISAFVDYCVDSNHTLEEYDKKLNACKSQKGFLTNDNPNHNKYLFNANSNAERDAPGARITSVSKGAEADPEKKRRLSVHKNGHPTEFGHDTDDDDTDDTDHDDNDVDRDDKGIDNRVNYDDETRKDGTLPGTPQSGVDPRHPARGGERAEDGDDDEQDAYHKLDISKRESECLLRLKARLPQDAEKSSRRRINTKFALAKKKFSKKRNVDKRSSACDTETLNELQPEEYVITR